MRVPVGISAGAIGAVVGAALLLANRTPDRLAPIDGFARTSLAAQHDIERRIADFPSTRRLQADHRFLTAEPHVAGTPRDRQLAEWTRDQWIAAGLDSVEIVEHRVLLPYPRAASVDMVAPHAWRGTLREDANAPLAFHAYGASGEVTAPAVTVGSGSKADFDQVAARGVDLRGKIVLVRYAPAYSYRGYAVYLAQQHGAAAVLMYPDHADGVPDDRIQRGGVSFDFLQPGDPTPVTLPRIISLPISTRDAHTILDAMRGGPVTLRVRVLNDDAVRPVWTVIGRINGSVHPDEWVIAGNHRDAWTYGGVDPSSGSTVLMETARALGALAKSGARPKRTVVLASWDAEEYALTSSTEWAEEHERELREKAVAYLNVDAAISGATFSARAVPSLAHLVAATAGVADSTIDTRIGAGSDYAVFLNFLGVPIVDLRFEDEYPVYHSAYDTHDWVARTDRGFLRHAELTRIWAVLAMRLANADVIPLDHPGYARRIREFLSEIEQQWGRPLRLASEALARFDSAASVCAALAGAALESGDRAALDAMNRSLIDVERAFIDPAGLEGRPWYRHQIYAPAFSYAPELLPGLAHAIATGDAARVAAAERRLAEALDRASRKLFTTFPAPPAS